MIEFNTLNKKRSSPGNFTFTEENLNGKLYFLWSDNSKDEQS